MKRFMEPLKKAHLLRCPRRHRLRRTSECDSAGLLGLPRIWTFLRGSKRQVFQRALISFLALPMLLFVGGDLAAELKPAALKQKAPLTQRDALLQQVDILSLYFSTKHIAHAPRFLEGHIEIESTLLDDEELTTERDRLEGFLSRQIATFLQELDVRLKGVAPDVARSFEAEKDVRFVINRGPERYPVATWENGELHWHEVITVAPVMAAKPTRASVLNQARTVEKSKRRDKSWENCPTYRD